MLISCEGFFHKAFNLLRALMEIRGPSSIGYGEMEVGGILLEEVKKEEK